MKNITITAGVLAALATSAVAQHTYQWDDGTAENSLGLTAGGVMTWLNGYQIVGLNAQINSVDISFTTGGAVTAGAAFNVHLWSDPNSDGNPADAILLDTVATTIDGSAITADGSVFQNVLISEILAGAAGTWFYVGASMNHTAGQFPAAFDQDDPDSGNAWVNVGGPENLSGVLNMGGIGFPGDFMVRANATAVPEPGTFVAIGLGLAGLALARRRK